MKWSFAISLFFAATLAAQEVAPPEIISITPSTGPTSGGTSVAIVGRNLGLPPNFACIVPCPARVRFGGEEVIVQQETQTLLVAVTPPHPAGVVDVTVRTGDGRTVTAPSAFTFQTGSSADYSRVLVPIHLDGTTSGGHGSSWETKFYLRNNATENLVIAPWPCESEVCLPVVPTTKILRPGFTIFELPPFFRAPTSNTSRLLYLSHNAARFASINARIFERSSETTDAGTEIPIVREEDLFVETVRLHGVPVRPEFRLMLRIYEVGQLQSDFLVQVFDEGSSAPSATFSVRAASTESGEFRTQAAYAQYADIAAGVTAPSGRVRVEVTPQTSGSQFWAFIAITNNETQRTTLITPQ